MTTDTNTNAGAEVTRYTTAEAEAYLRRLGFRVESGAIARKCARGVIAAIKLPGSRRWWIERSALELYVRGQRAD